MTKKKEPSGLSRLGDNAEKMLKIVLDDMQADWKRKVEERKYSLTDVTKLIDRVAKFEAIRAKLTDDEGGFFKNKGGQENDDDGT